MLSLGVYVVNHRVFRCSLDAARRGFHRAANSIFGKVGRVASDEVVIQLISSKCLPVLLYGLEACALTKAYITSLDFVLNRPITCKSLWPGFRLPSELIVSRTKIFESSHCLLEYKLLIFFSYYFR